MYYVHSGLQDESLQVTISKLPKGSLTCTGGDFPCTGDIHLTSRSEGRCTYLDLSLQMTLAKACSDTVCFVFVCFVALRPKSTAMVIAGRSVHLTTLFPGQA